MEKRVVITGLGTICPIGNNVQEMWNSIKENKCGIDFIKAFDTENFKTKVAAEVKNYNDEDYFEIKEAKRLDRVSKFAMIAAREAYKDAGITKENINHDNIGIFIASGIGGFNTLQTQIGTNEVKGNKRVSPMFIPMGISNMPAGNVSIGLGLKGESICHVTACASSTHSIGEAYRTIKHGYEEVILAGGSEAAICTASIAGFENMKALSSSENPNRASIPFDKERNGFVMGEGAAVVVLEEYEHAKTRGAKIYGEVIGYGASSDAYHITSPDPESKGAIKAMNRAIEDAKINPSDIDYINAHGTSTHLNDVGETIAIKEVFKDNAKNVKVSSTKGNTGHLLGAAGAIETIICTKALENGLVPATINYKVEDEECDLNVVPNNNIKQDLNIVMSNSLGFGGHNGCLILKKYNG